MVGEKVNNFWTYEIVYLYLSYMDNYLDLTVEEVYEIICDGNNWPEHFGSADKIQLLENMVTYFASRDEFEKCTKLQKMIKRIGKSKTK